MDKTTEIILEIENVERISFEQSFRIVSYCTQLLSQHSAEAELSARKIVIHVLILSILVYTFFTRMFDFMLPLVVKYSIVAA